MPRAQRSVVVPVTDTRATTSAPAATAPVPLHQLQLHQQTLSSLESSLHHLMKTKPESRLALCIFCELFGNLLPKGEKNVEIIGFKRECCFCSLMFWWLNFIFLFEILYAFVRYLDDHVFDHKLHLMFA